MRIKDYLRFSAILYLVFFIITGIFILAEGILINPGNNKFIYFVMCFAPFFHGLAVATIILAIEKLLNMQNTIVEYLKENMEDKGIRNYESFHLFKN